MSNSKKRAKVDEEAALEESLKANAASAGRRKAGDSHKSKPIAAKGDAMVRFAYCRAGLTNWVG